MNNIRRGHVTYYVNCIQLWRSSGESTTIYCCHIESRGSVCNGRRREKSGILGNPSRHLDRRCRRHDRGWWLDNWASINMACSVPSARLQPTALRSPSCPNHPSSQNTLPRAPRNPPPGNRIHTSQPWSSLRRTALSPRYSPIVLSIGNILGNSSFRMANTFLSTTSRCSKSCGSTTTMQKLRLPC